MVKSGLLVGKGQLFALVLAACALSGCASKQDKAIDQAKAQAAQTGQAQQVVSVDKNGNTTTIVVQPPAKGQSNEAITTVVTPPAPGAQIPAASGPTITALPPPPVSVSILAGTPLTIRIDQNIGVKHSRAGDTFTGEIVDPVVAGDNSVLVPKGALVGGIVDVSHRRGHFKGRSLLELRLTSLTLNGQQYQLTTRDLAESKRGKGRRSAAMIGGGAGLGMLVGGVASGGVGLLVGGLVGGGGGTALAGLTGNRDLDIRAESIVHFTLEDDLVVQVPPPSPNTPSPSVRGD
jgi:outer membrane murein-binding lipoprotein Lpp